MSSEVFTHNDVTFVRHGECNRCGECCRSGDPFNGQMGAPEIPGACPLLTVDMNGIYSCKDRQNHYYLIGCRIWPSRPEHIVDYPSCSYTFERID